jgi:glycosyltransferase involved in cell wall biosynthesis
MTRVAIFTDNDFDKVNGVTTTLQALLRHQPAGIRARVYTASRVAVETPDYLALRSPGVPIPFYAEMRMYLPRLGEYRRRTRADRIDLIHLTTPGPIGLAGLWVARQLGLPIVGSFHTDLAAYTRILSGSTGLAGGMRHYLRWHYGRCQRILVPSDATRVLLARAHGDADRMCIWRRGVDADHFTPARRSDTLRQAWRVSADRPAVLYVGRVSREKGLNLLPDVQRALRELGIAHRFIIAGDGPMRLELSARLSDAVFTGTLGRDEVADAFASADLFVFPSRTDTAANVVLEAQASGLPVLVTDEGGPKENILDGSSGRIIGARDTSAWAAALTPLLRYAECREAMGRRARAYAESRSWPSALAPLFETYREVAEAFGLASAVPDLVTRGAPS